jgi:hypothetical protein
MLEGIGKRIKGDPWIAQFRFSLSGTPRNARVESDRSSGGRAYPALFKSSGDTLDDQAT